MLKNYLTVAFRTLRRDRGYALLNVAGLAVGLGCCLLIGLYVLDEVRFDRFHPTAERTFRVVEVRETPDLGDQRVAATVGPVSTALVETAPEVAAATRLSNLQRLTVERGEHRAYVGDYLIAEPSFFDVFDGFDLLQGDPATALSAPHSLVLTASAARPYFGDEDPMGQTVTVEGLGDLTVTGVLADPPANSHLTFSMLLSAATLASDAEWWADYADDWTPNWRSFLAYVTLDDAAAAPAVEARLADLLAQHGEAESPTRALELQPLTDVHFGSGAIEDVFNHDERPVTTLYAFSAIALFVLLIACINYMNLATARSMRRAREVGVRKALGARRGQLAGQFLSESVLLAGAAVAAAAGLAALVLPAFNEIAGKALMLTPVGGGWLLLGLVGLALVVGVAAGSYPALYLSGFRPTRALRGVESGRRGAGLRRGLVVTQFALSIGLIVATLTVVRQMEYVQSAPLGFESDGLVVVDINSGDVRRQWRAVKAEMAALPAVRSVSSTSRVPGDWKNIAEIEAVPEGTADATPRTLAFFGADEDFLRTFDVALETGRTFSASRPADSAAVLLNETAVRALGLEDPVGQRLTIPQTGGEAELALDVIGVVEDFHFRSLHEPIRPLVIGAWNNPVQSIDYFTARVDPAALPAAIAGLRTIGERFDPEHPFEYNVLDERLADFYVSEARTARLLGIAGGLALFIACLGLLGLAAFVAEQRTKEIGVRKVLGASVGSIVFLLSKDFARLVLVGAAIAVPLAYLGMRQWLDGFAYRVDLGPGVFVLAGGVALAVALATVSARAVHAALADPVRSLRHE